MAFNNWVKKYFKNDGYFYIFILAYTDGRSRCELLGITQDLYTDKAKAIKWHQKIYKKISPFENEVNHRDYKQAIGKLEELFENMIDSEV